MLRKRLLSLALMALVALFGVACENTGQGIQEDVEENVERAEEELNEEGDG